mmetsp:Transcript_88681/g.246269  ORF Transcript_88681/g.246269 Transcript_88681/m.246269 type:complete len:248 (+) Transcript_88681:467-1210(+)
MYARDGHRAAATLGLLQHGTQANCEVRWGLRWVLAAVDVYVQHCLVSAEGRAPAECSAAHQLVPRVRGKLTSRQVVWVAIPRVQQCTPGKSILFSNVPQVLGAALLLFRPLKGCALELRGDATRNLGGARLHQVWCVPVPQHVDGVRRGHQKGPLAMFLEFTAWQHGPRLLPREQLAQLFPVHCILRGGCQTFDRPPPFFDTSGITVLGQPRARRGALQVSGGPHRVGSLLAALRRRMAAAARALVQ